MVTECDSEPMPSSGTSVHNIYEKLAVARDFAKDATLHFFQIVRTVSKVPCVNKYNILVQIACLKMQGMLVPTLSSISVIRARTSRN